MTHRLPAGRLQVTVLNFAQATTEARIRSPHLPVGEVMIDMVTGRDVATVDADHGVEIVLEPHAGLSLLVKPGELPPLELDVERDADRHDPGESHVLAQFGAGPPGVGPLTGIGSGEFYPSPDIASESASDATP